MRLDNVPTEVWRYSLSLDPTLQNAFGRPLPSRKGTTLNEATVVADDSATGSAGAERTVPRGGGKSGKETDKEAEKKKKKEKPKKEESSSEESQRKSKK